MTDYLKKIAKTYTIKTFKRKQDYIKYNLGRFIGNLSKKSDVLEIGPGMGELVDYLNDQGLKNIDLVDNNYAVLKNIKNNYQISNIFKTESISTLKLGKYDLVIGIQVFEHIKISDQAKILKKLYDALNTGGRLIIVVPNANNPLGITERYGDIQHVTSYTTRSINDLVIDSGIDRYKLKIHGYEIPPYSLINIIRIFFQKILHLVLLLIIVINGGVYYLPLTPNLICIIRKK